MGTIGSTTFDRHGHTWDVRLLQSGSTASLGLRITSLTREQGSPGAMVLSPILAGRLQLSIRDDGKNVLDRLQSNSQSDFSIEVDQDGSRWHEGMLIDSSLGDSAWSSPKLDLTFDDRLQQANGPQQHLTPTGAGGNTASFRWEYGPSNDNYQTIGRVPACMLHTVTDLPVRTYWNFDSNDRSGKAKVTGHRMRVLDIGRHRFPPPRQFALEEFCMAFGLQCVQHDGKFWLLERVMRGQSSSFAEYETTGTFSNVSTGSEDRSVTLSDSDIRTKEPIQEKIRYPKYTRLVLGRRVLHANSDEFPITSTTDSSEPAADVYTFNVGSESPLTFQDGSNTVSRDFAWERPANENDSMSVEVTLEVDVASSASFDGGSSTVKLGEFTTRDSSSQSTQNLNATFSDTQAGTTVTETYSLSVSPGEEAYRISFQFTPDPDGDGTFELNEQRLTEVKATWAEDVQSRTPSDASESPNESVKNIKTSIGEPRITTGPSDEPSVAGAVAVWTGSTFERVFGGSWTHSILGTIQGLQGASTETMRRQVQPVDDPLEGWVIRQDLGAPGDITHAFDYESLTHVPIHARTDVLKGTREITMYELRTT